MSAATRRPARNAALRPCQFAPIGVNSENALAQFALIRRNRRSSSGFSRNLRKEVSKQEKSYFWRVHTGAEIDIVEEREGEIYAYECKWSRPAGQPAARARAPQGVVPGRLPRRVVRGHHSGELPGVSGRIIATVPGIG